MYLRDRNGQSSTSDATMAHPLGMRTWNGMLTCHDAKAYDDRAWVRMNACDWDGQVLRVGSGSVLGENYHMNFNWEQACREKCVQRDGHLTRSSDANFFSVPRKRQYACISMIKKVHHPRSFEANLIVNRINSDLIRHIPWRRSNRDWMITHEHTRSR